MTDITWQDEHSAPFSWETKSQMEFSVASLSIQEQGGAQLQNEQRQPVKAAPGVQVPKSSQANKTPGSEGLIASRKEEELSFWKINAERSKFEGDKSEFQSLTPSQIKSMEKGEKPLPSLYRQECAPKEVTKAEKPSITKPEKSVAPSLPSVSLEWEKPRPAQLPTSSLDDFFLPDPPQDLASSRTNKEDTDGTILTDPQMPGQTSTSNVILKTGFDFLDNWQIHSIWAPFQHKEPAGLIVQSPEMYRASPWSLCWHQPKHQGDFAQPNLTYTQLKHTGSREVAWASGSNRTVRGDCQHLQGLSFQTNTLPTSSLTLERQSSNHWDMRHHSVVVGIFSAPCARATLLCSETGQFFERSGMEGVCKH
ncbi:hypothetical protein IHE44_0009207 [Lamprotornis superbus]|uniref:DUF4706 domain-containing protein n=1 Tax=Lamprotornis superbus TaxID=245042 RepID=A0A835NYG9_9PASS|nr:hypothetical protein IHE44_0009207 [Lamprotornis superbus]